MLSVRVSSEERALLEAASDQARTSLSDFVRRKAVEAAEVDEPAGDTGASSPAAAAPATAPSLDADLGAIAGAPQPVHFDSDIRL